MSRTLTSINDVALAAGVSRNTVSLALRGSDRVKPETRQRVLTVAERLEYLPNRVAQAMVTGKSRVLGLVIPKLDFSYMPALVESIHELALQHGYSMLFSGHRDDADKLSAAVDFLLERRVEGLLIYRPTAALSLATLQKLKRATVPVVFISFNDLELPGIVFDICPAEAGAVALHRVAELGHKRIAYLGPASGLFEQSRWQGVRTVAGALELPAVDFWQTDYSLEGGRQAAHRFLAAADKPTALVCFADPIAVGALQEFVRIGVRVPKDVSVVGVDDLPMAEAAAVPLSTLRAPASDLGKSAVEEFLKTSNTRPGQSHGRRQFHWHWVNRESLAPPT
jgi:LacI family transcriptional regulator